jgi:hypothetical protein
VNLITQVTQANRTTTYSSSQYIDFVLIASDPERMISDTLIRGGAILHLAVVTITALTDISLFILHPICMALFIYAFAEAAISLRSKKSMKVKRNNEEEKKRYGPRSEQIDQHASVAFAAVTTAILGFTVGILIKRMDG